MEHTKIFFYIFFVKTQASEKKKKKQAIHIHSKIHRKFKTIQIRQQRPSISP
jgi:hypothetical protein